MRSHQHSLIECRTLSARTWTWLGVTGGLLVAVVAATAVLATRKPKPVPGVRAATWTTQRDLPAAGDPGMRTKKFQVHRARRYLGPPPSPDELAALRATGRCDALEPWLREPWKSQVAAAVRGFEEALDTVGDSCDAAIEEAKARIRGTADEYVRQDPTSIEPGLREFTDRAQKDKDMCVYDSFEGRMRHYRIRRDAHPLVYELRRQDAEIAELRRTALHEEIAELLQREGRTILDEPAMQRAWDDVLARAER